MSYISSISHLTFYNEYIMFQDTADFAKRVISGNGDDRWFDKSFTNVISPVGDRMGWNVEHSNIDAMVKLKPQLSVYYYVNSSIVVFWVHKPIQSMVNWQE